jgi:hypothetical protein
MRSVCAQLALLVLLAVPGFSAHVAADRPEPQALPAGWSAAPPADGAISPGRETPSSAPPEAALIMSWGGDYRTLLVIGPGAGIVRPAWIMTYQEASDTLQVAYRATAFRDQHGVIHFDGREALMVGPMADANQWSPDSMAIFGNGTVQTQDDDPSHPRETGVITKVIPAGDPAYKPLLLMAQVIVGDGT